MIFVEEAREGKNITEQKINIFCGAKQNIASWDSEFLHTDIS
jgi:hypothetical protein